jgi:hypothetical protein
VWLPALGLDRCGLEPSAPPRPHVLNDLGDSATRDGGEALVGNVFAAGRTMPAARATWAAIGKACDPYRRVAGERDGLAKVSDMTAAHTLHRQSLSA